MILIAAGSSLPFCDVDSQQLVLSAFLAIGRFADVRATSSLYETPAWPDRNDPPFINAAAVIETGLAPRALLAALHAVEAGLGRVRREANAPRSLDLDLLAYSDTVLADPDGPQIPHPRLHERDFVLAPLADIAPDWAHPVIGQTVVEMLQSLEQVEAKRIS